MNTGNCFHCGLEINKKEAEYMKTQDEKVFWSEVTDSNSYYFANLSGYSRKIHKPYNEYLEMREMLKGVDSEVKKDEGEEDLSWLNDLN
jgi:hypothetical protein